MLDTHCLREKKASHNDLASLAVPCACELDGGGNSSLSVWTHLLSLIPRCKLSGEETFFCSLFVQRMTVGS